LAAAVLGAGYSAHNARPGYQESATVLFTWSARNSAADAHVAVSPSLITTGEAVSQILMSPRVRRQVGAADGTAAYDVSLINSYNEDYPEFAYPELTLKTASNEAARTHRTFTVVARTLVRILASRQRVVNVRPAERIVAQIIADSGPVPLSGSKKRAFAGLILLAIVIGSAGWSALNRRHGTTTRPNLNTAVANLGWDKLDRSAAGWDNPWPDNPGRGRPGRGRHSRPALGRGRDQHIH